MNNGRRGILLDSSTIGSGRLGKSFHTVNFETELAAFIEANEDVTDVNKLVFVPIQTSDVTVMSNMQTG